MSRLFIVMLLFCLERNNIRAQWFRNALLSNIGCQEFNESHSCDYSRLDDQECGRGTGSWQICVYHSGHPSLMRTAVAHAISFPGGHELCCPLAFDLNENNESEISLLAFSDCQEFRSFLLDQFCPKLWELDLLKWVFFDVFIPDNLVKLLPVGNSFL